MFTLYSKRLQTFTSLTTLVMVGLNLGLIATSNMILPQSVAAENTQIAKASTELPIVKSAALGTNMDVPWSKPVKIEDPFEGDYIGIFDRNYFNSNFLDTEARIEVVSLWSRDSIRFLLAYGDRDCYGGYSFHHYGIFTGPRCIGSENTVKLAHVYIKLGKQVFKLESKNGKFSVDDSLAAALRNSPVENVKIRLVAEGGEAIDSQIGKKTVQGWKVIY